MTKNKHSGDCTYYSSLINERPEDGICTCGYGLESLRETGNREQLYSKELKRKLEEKDSKDGLENNLKGAIK